MRWFGGDLFRIPLGTGGVGADDADVGWREITHKHDVFREYWCVATNLAMNVAIDLECSTLL